MADLLSGVFGWGAIALLGAFAVYLAARIIATAIIVTHRKLDK